MLSISGREVSRSRLFIAAGYCSLIALHEARSVRVITPSLASLCVEETISAGTKYVTVLSPQPLSHVRRLRCEPQI